MILVLLLCLLISLIMLIIILILISTIKIYIKKVEITNLKMNKPKYEIDITLNLVNKFKWFVFKLNNRKIKNIFRKMHLEKIDIKDIEKNVSLFDIKEILNIKPKLEKMNLRIKLGVEDVILTSFLVPLFTAIISVILPYITEKKNIKNIYYKFEPIYNNKNIYDIKFSGIVEIKIINLLNALYSIYRNKKINKSNNRIELKNV